METNKNRNILIAVIVIVVVVLLVLMMGGDKVENGDNNSTSTLSGEEQELNSLNADLDAEFKAIDSDAQTL